MNLETLAAASQKPYRDEKFLAFLAQQICTLRYTAGHVCQGRIDPAHGPVDGIASKGPDDEAIPLCRAAHDEQHRIGWERFERKYHFKRLLIAALWWAVYTGKVKMEDYTLRTSDAALRLGVSIQRVKQMVYEGSLPQRKVGSQWRFSEADIRAALSAKQKRMEKA